MTDLSTRNTIARKTAIVGIGATEFSKDSGRSELQLAVEATLAAISDAGLKPGDIDGMVTYSADTNPDIDIARAAGIGELTFFSRVHYGGGACCGTILQAVLAVATGVATNVVCYRAFNERSGNRFGAGVQNRPPVPSAENAQFAWYAPFGLLTPAQWVAMFTRRYMHQYGASGDDLGRVAVAGRDFASTNPKAWFYNKPITLEDHQNSRYIAEPLRLLDCCQESDGGQAVVVTTLDRARDLPNRPAIIAGVAQGAGEKQDMMTSYYRDNIAHLPEMALVARQIWEMSEVGVKDLSCAILYDAFTPFVLMQLEDFGFCPRGQAKDYVKDGNIGRGAKTPINTHGGQLGEAYIHGMNGIAEGVRQIRGTSPNQLDKVENVLVSSGTGVPTSAMVLTQD